MKFCKIIFPTILLVSMVMNSHAADRIGGKTVQETFPAAEVANFVIAVRAGNYARADELIKSGANVNAIGADGITPLLWIMAATLDPEKVDYLLMAGADPNYRVSDNQASAMFVAAGGNRSDILEELLKNKGDPNLMGPRHESLLMVAVGQLRKKNAEILLKYGADINYRDLHGDTVADKAVSVGRFDWVAEFLNQGLTHDLQGLAKSVEIRQVPHESEQQQWKEKVIEMLKVRGVKFPAFVPCFPPGDPRRKEADCDRFKR